MLRTITTEQERLEEVAQLQETQREAERRLDELGKK